MPKKKQPVKLSIEDAILSPSPPSAAIGLAALSAPEVAELLADLLQRVKTLEEIEKARSTTKPKRRKYSEPPMPCGVCGSEKTYWIKRGSPDRQYMVTRCECGKTSNRKNI